MNSAGRRKRGPRARRRLLGSRACRRVSPTLASELGELATTTIGGTLHDVTICLMRRLMSQPLSMKSTASQSSSSGWVGYSPWAPKSAGVRTRPAPKSICQRRFTATRAVSGCSRMVIQLARPRRIGAAQPAGGGGQDGGRARR